VLLFDFFCRKPRRDINPSLGSSCWLAGGEFVRGRLANISPATINHLISHRRDRRERDVHVPRECIVAARCIRFYKCGLRLHTQAIRRHLKGVHTVSTDGESPRDDRHGSSRHFSIHRLRLRLTCPRQYRANPSKLPLSRGFADAVCARATVNSALKRAKSALFFRTRRELTRVVCTWTKRMNSGESLRDRPHAV